VQYGSVLADCPICLDERQYVGWEGQGWTSNEELLSEGYRGRLDAEGDRVVGIGIQPSFAIGQRALLVCSDAGNILWDCIPFLDDALFRSVQDLGGIAAIAVSHPHFYGAMVEWAHAFDVPVLIHEADRQWVGRPDPLVEYWGGSIMDLRQGATLINAGIHFEGGTVLHVAGDEPLGGDLFSGDIFQVVMDRRWVSFMYSYPNLIPERPSVIRSAVEKLEPFEFARIYGAFWGRVTPDGSAALRRSANRYIRYATESGPADSSQLD
jgi:hypothetical protein